MNNQSPQFVLSIGQEVRADRFCIQAEQAMQLVSISQPKVFVACEINVQTLQQNAFLQDKEFWRLLYASLNDDAMLAVLMNEPKSVEQLLKMSGFTQIMVTDSRIVAKKPVFKQGGTSIRNRQKKQEQDVEAVSNPWGALSEQPELIDEAALLTDQKVDESTKKFCGSEDRIMPGKPCANCTCGKKDLLESSEGQAKLETGQVQSSCGNCYLGDAFRCSGCPYAGKPAFEAGDKVLLKNATVSQQEAGQLTENVKLQDSIQTKVVLEL